MRAEAVQVTPQLARQWLTKNTRNRHLSPALVRRYADALRAGQWVPHGQAIQFDESGNLLDGQHRLRAIVEADTSAEMMVVRGVPEVARDVIDTGRRRSPGDVLSMEGVRDSATVGAALRLLFHYDTGSVDKYSDPRSKPSNVDLVQLYAEARSIDESAAVGQKAFRLLSPAVGTFAHFVFARLDRKAADEFFGGLIEGADLDKDSPLLLLRNRLLANRASRSRLQAIDLAALVFKAWNAWRRGGPLRYLRWRRKGESPEEFPTAI
ncbi:MAG: hypothetical protein HY900_32220 [Deltaproteobacteria bacterium]|nr:hypothetical protein [Deltaproteobacteria bacterium]